MVRVAWGVGSNTVMEHLNTGAAGAWGVCALDGPDAPHAPPAAAFTWVDTATGGPHRRNRVKDVTCWQPPAGTADVFITWCRFTDDLPEYARGHTSAAGASPSVEGYDGPSTATFVPFDFDGPAARDDLRRLLRALEARYAIDLGAPRVFYSGGKGFHLEISATLFGVAQFGPMPCRPLARRIKRLAQHLTDGLELPSLDGSIYDALRLWRVTGSRHGGTGRYKIPLTAGEAFGLNIADIEALAASPRTIDVPADDEWQPVPDLADLWRRVEAEPEEARTTTNRVIGTASAADVTAEQWEQAIALLTGCFPGEGARHQAMGALAGGLLGDGWSEDATEGFLDDLAIAVMGEQGRRRAEQGEGRRWVASTMERLRTGEPATGWPALADHISGDAVDRFRDLLGLRATVSLDAPAVAEPKSLDEVRRTFRRWLYLPDDGVLLFLLGVIAANLRPGDPVWGMIVGGSSSGKTEPLLAAEGLPFFRLTSTISSEGALLSGSAKREREQDATGGLLRVIGDFGIVGIKDFTSIMSMQRDARAAVLAALREIFDGEWVRFIGAGGGRRLSWRGKLGLIAACTTAIDSAHAVTGLLGERFIYFRLPPYDRPAQAQQALANIAHVGEMRAELAAAVRGLFAGVDVTAPLPAHTAVERRRFVALADLAALCRTGVERDARTREVELIPDPEGPARLAGTLARLYDGMRAIGVDGWEAWGLVVKVAFDSMPKLRRGVFDLLTGLPADGQMSTTAVATTLGYPTSTASRALQDLTVHGVVTRIPGAAPQPDYWRLSNQTRTALVAINSEMSPAHEGEN